MFNWKIISERERYGFAFRQRALSTIVVIVLENVYADIFAGNMLLLHGNSWFNHTFAKNVCVMGGIHSLYNDLRKINPKGEAVQ